MKNPNKRQLEKKIKCKLINSKEGTYTEVDGNDLKSLYLIKGKKFNKMEIVEVLTLEELKQLKTKWIYNPVTGKEYEVRTEKTEKGNKGSLTGKTRKPIKELSSTPNNN